MRDLPAATLARRHPPASIGPRRLRVSQVAEPLSRPVAVVAQHGLDGRALLLRQAVWIAVGPGSAQLEQAAMMLPQRGAHRAVGPGLDRLAEEGRIVPHQRPRLAVV